MFVKFEYDRDIFFKHKYGHINTNKRLLPLLTSWAKCTTCLVDAPAGICPKTIGKRVCKDSNICRTNKDYCQ